jgi:hypothetical protein
MMTLMEPWISDGCGSIELVLYIYLMTSKFWSQLEMLDITDTPDR